MIQRSALPLLRQRLPYVKIARIVFTVAVGVCFLVAGDALRKYPGVESDIVRIILYFETLILLGLLWSKSFLLLFGVKL